MRANLARVGARVASSYGTRASYAGANSAAHFAEAVVCSAIPSGPVGYPVEGGRIDVTAARTAPGQLRLRDAPAGTARLRTSARRRSPSPATRSRPSASSTSLARLERGRPIRLADVVDRLNATYLDWLFTRAGRRRRRCSSSRRTGWPTTATLGDRRRRRPVSARRSTIEDSSRVDPWIVRQAQRELVAVYASGSPRSAAATEPTARADLHARVGRQTHACLPLSPAGPIPLIGGPLPTSSQPQEFEGDHP